MGIFEAFDFSALFTLEVLLALLGGSAFGMVVGVLPGLGSVLAVALLLPLTFSMTPLAGILLLLAAYQSAEYGGSISAIILGIPGTPSSFLTALDGTPMARQGLGGRALGYSLAASVFGGLLSGVVLILLAVPLTTVAMRISSPEIFLLTFAGLLSVGTLGSRDMVKGYISVVVGLMASMVGMDKISGVYRYTFGSSHVADGLGLIALVAGVFGISEVIRLVVRRLHVRYVTPGDGVTISNPFRGLRKMVRPLAIGGGFGVTTGLVPGMGTGPSAWFAYSLSRRTSKSRATYGKGNPEGIVAAESAGNATAGGSLIPLLSLGIPGSPSIAIVLGAFVIHGIQPGPNLFESNPRLVYAIMAGFLLTSVVMLVLGFFFTNVFSHVLRIPNALLVPVILTFILGGVFASRRSFTDLWIALVAGVIAYVAERHGYSVAAFVLAFVLGPFVELNLRRALVFSDGSYTVFLTRPVSLVLVVLLMSALVFIISQKLRKRSASRRLLASATEEVS